MFSLLVLMADLERVEIITEALNWPSAFLSEEKREKCRGDLEDYAEEIGEIIEEIDERKEGTEGDGRRKRRISTLWEEVKEDFKTFSIDNKNTEALHFALFGTYQIFTDIGREGKREVDRFKRV